MNLKQLVEERAAAGADYAQQVDALRNAFIRLASVERTISNANVASHMQLPGFHRNRLQLGEALKSIQHCEFASQILIGEWNDPISVASDSQIQEFTR